MSSHPVLSHGQLVKQEDPSSRTTSPTVLLHQGHPDCSGSPLATSQSTLSTSSPLSSDQYHYAHGQQYIVHRSPGGATSRSPMPTGTTSIPVPVRSASWAAGTQEPSPANSVPAIIMTQQDGNPEGNSMPPLPTFRLTAKPNNKLSPVKKKQTSKKGDKVSTGKSGDTVNARRQKRLERNRESARLSRRRRKQYLEVLEDRVTQLSLDMDQGRRAHAAAAIETVLAKRRELLSNQGPIDPDKALLALDTSLSRTSQELAVLMTFQLQQLKSFALPPHSKFVLWLTLQGDVYFRGGRAASERLSAARIGERMLISGNDRVTPINSMWPLFCNEVGLSYDQEERVRNFQRTLLQDSPTWLERHSARASTLVMQSFHDSLHAVGAVLHQRECTSTSRLSSTQRLKFLAWTEKNAQRLRDKFHYRREALRAEKESEEFKTSPSHHIAANLYILNHRLQRVLAQFPPQVELVNAAHRKRLSRRPSFESLGQQKDDLGSPMTRDSSFASSGSLKRSVSSLSMVSENGEEKPPQQVSPEDGEAVAQSLIEKELGFVKNLIPPIVQPVLPPAPAPMPVSLPPAPQPYHANHYAPAPPSHPAQVVQSSTSYTPIYHHNYQPQIQAHPTPTQHQQTHPVASYQGAPQHDAPPPIAPPPAAHQSYQQYYAPQPSAPPPVAHQQQIYSQPMSAPMQYSAQHPAVYNPHMQGAPVVPSADVPQHVRKSSFLPSHLNVVPEEMFTSGDGAEEFLMSLIDDGDWAIGEGVDMDTTN